MPTIPKKKSSHHLPNKGGRIPRPAKKSDSSLTVNVGAQDYQKGNLVTKYEAWLYPGLSQTKFDGFDTCCPSTAETQSSGATSTGNKALCRRIPNVNELTTLLFAPDEKCLRKWEKTLIGRSDMRIENVQDELIQSQVLCIMGKADGSVCIKTPRAPLPSLGIKLPYLNMIVRNLDCYFSFEVEILDNMGMKRLFKMSNFQSLVRVKAECCCLPMRLDVGWNQVTIDLPAFVRDAFGTRYKETIRLQINANIYVRRVYFSAELFDEITLPAEYKIFPLGEFDKAPLYRKRNVGEDERIELKDIHLNPFQSRDEFVNGLFDTTSGYIQIDEENWDKPKIIVKPEAGLKFPPHRKPISPRPGDSPQSEDSLRVFSSLEARHRMKSFFQQGANQDQSTSKLVPITSILLTEHEQEHARYSTPNVATLLEDLSEVFDFLAAASGDIIPQASEDTIADLESISESLKDMASFSGIWQNKPDVKRSSENIEESKIEAEKQKATRFKGMGKNRFQLENFDLMTDEEVLLTIPGHGRADGIPIHPAPTYGSEPSMQILNLSMSRQVLAHVQMIERRRTIFAMQSEARASQSRAESVTPKTAVSKVELPPEEAESCLDFAAKAYAASTTSLKDFASLSSQLLEKLQTVSKFTDNFSRSRTSLKSKNSSHEVMMHLRKMSLALKDVASISTVDAIRQTQSEKAAERKSLAMETLQQSVQQLEDQQPSLFEDPPEMKGSVEVFNSYSSDCCMLKPDPPFLLRHDDGGLPIRQASGMSLFDSNSSLTPIQTPSTPDVVRKPAAPDGISTLFLKSIRKHSTDMVKNFSTESLRTLSNSGIHTSYLRSSDSHKLIKGAGNEESLEPCALKYKPEHKEHESYMSLKYVPSTSTTRVDTPEYSGESIAQYEVQFSVSADGANLDEIEPFLDYEAVGRESWEDFFKPTDAKDENENLGSMSSIWDKFGQTGGRFPIGFDMSTTPAKSPQSACSSSVSGDTPKSISSEDSCFTNQKSGRKSTTGKLKKALSRGLLPSPPKNEVVVVPPKSGTFSLPVSKSVSSTSSPPRSLADSESLELDSDAEGRKICSKARKPHRIPKLKKPLHGSSHTSLESYTDSVNSDKNPTLKVLKKLCLEILKRPPSQALRYVGLPILPTSDHGFWSPRVQSSDSEAEDVESEISGSDSEPEAIFTPESMLFGHDYYDDDECVSRSASSTQTLVMISPPGSVYTPELSPRAPSSEEHLLSDVSEEGTIELWGAPGEETPPLSLSSKSSESSNESELLQADRGDTPNSGESIRKPMEDKDYRMSFFVSHESHEHHHHHHHHKRDSHETEASTHHHHHHHEHHHEHRKSVHHHEPRKSIYPGSEPRKSIYHPEERRKTVVHHPNEHRKSVIDPNLHDHHHHHHGHQQSGDTADGHQSGRLGDNLSRKSTDNTGKYAEYKRRQTLKDLTTILAPDQSEATLFHTEEGRKRTLSHNSISGLTPSTAIIVQNTQENGNGTKMQKERSGSLKMKSLSQPSK